MLHEEVRPLRLSRWPLAAPAAAAVLALLLWAAGWGAWPWALAALASPLPLLLWRPLGDLRRSLDQVAAAVARAARGQAPGALDLPDAAQAQALEEALAALASRLQALTGEEERLQAILGTMAEGVILLDRRGRVLLLNPAAEAMFGRRRDEVVGRHHLELTYHLDLDAQVAQALATGQAAEFELRRATPAEQVLAGRLAPVRPAPGAPPDGVLVVLHDVTRARRLERLRREFVANVSHELRTPLTAIRGFAETLLHDDADPEVRRRFLQIIHDEAERLTRLIEDLLDLSRLEGGQVRLHRQPLALDRLAAEVVERVRPRAQAAGIHLDLDLPPPAALPAVDGDHDRLVQVLLNLLDNALKYTPAGGQVTVRVLPEPGAVRVEVQDTGPGIDPEHHNRLFERFYRADAARTRQTGGTGLGLAIVKHVVEAHGGSVGVRSRPGAGATFWFTLPAAPPATAPAAPAGDSSMTAPTEAQP